MQRCACMRCTFLPYVSEGRGQRLCCFTFWDVIADVVQEVDGRVEVADFQEGFLFSVEGSAEVEVVVQLGCLRKSQALRTKHTYTAKALGIGEIPPL